MANPFLDGTRVEDAHAGEGYASADMALWDCGAEGTDEPRLVAYGTQVFLFSFPPPPA